MPTCAQKRQKIRGEQIGKNYDDIFVLVTVNIKVTKSMCVCAMRAKHAKYMCEDDRKTEIKSGPENID